MHDQSYAALPLVGLKYTTFQKLGVCKVFVFES